MQSSPPSGDIQLALFIPLIGLFAVASMYRRAVLIARSRSSLIVASVPFLNALRPRPVPESEPERVRSDSAR